MTARTGDRIETDKELVDLDEGTVILDARDEVLHYIDSGEGLIWSDVWTNECHVSLPARILHVPGEQAEDYLQRLARAAFKVDSTHHFGFGDDGLTCLCGFVGSTRKRTQTEHITAAVIEEYRDDN